VNHIFRTIGLTIAILIFCACSQTKTSQQNKSADKGKLFIIGGGKRPAPMIEELIEIAGLKKPKTYTVVIPMASSEPDTSFYYFKKSLLELGITNVFNFNIIKPNDIASSSIDSILNANLIYITGGSQEVLMDLIFNTPVHKAIVKAYKNGSVVAGTSAGAAVQGRKMITGNEFKHPEYTGEFRTIEANNIEIKDGLGLLENAIIDQHFIWRMRMNRLITTAIENPEEICIGIDESTAILVENDSAQVTGLSQVVVLRNTKKISRKHQGLLGSEEMELSIYLPGEKFAIK
jgi:cyanophycinase